MEKIELHIPGLPRGVTIHIVGSGPIGWEEGLIYPQPDDEEKTTMEIDPDVVGVDFKHFVRSPVPDRRKVAGALRRAGYQVTGSGDQRGNLWRTWFIIATFPTYGGNNTFEE